MTDKQKLLPAILVALIAGWAGWYFISGWGLVTLDCNDTPVQKVLSSIARQGGIKIETNLDPSTPVTIKVKRVPPLEALDIVAARTEAAWRLAYLGSPDVQTIESALAAFRSSQQAEGWSSFGGGGFSLIEPRSGIPLDLRRVVWNPSGTANLHDTLRQIAGETGALTAAPKDWNPDTVNTKGGEVRRVVPELFAKLGGHSREVFLLRRAPQRTENADADADQPRRGGGNWIGSNPVRDAGSRGPWGDPQQAAARAEAQIALLPKDEQPEARKDLDTMRQFWGELRNLPEDQRRAKAQEFFNSPAMQERMEQRRMAREAKMTPEQRNQRSRRYFDRKRAAKSESEPPTGGAAR
ncbi:MAG: hypothetical protein FGM15_07750 [Chthoniobacterales bacterium]|nr:hypothetical protein [Chthoniobacterales bacterium]